MKLSKRYIAFNSELEVMEAYLTPETRARLMIPDSQHSEFTAQLTRWKSAFATYRNPETHTESAILGLKQSYAEIFPFVRNLRQQLKNNHAITLLPEDYAELSIHINKRTHTRIAPPEHAPVITWLGSHHLVSQFEVSLPTSADILHRALPKHLHIGRKLALVAAGPTPPAKSEYDLLAGATRARFTLQFKPEDEGKNGWLICWYANPREETGPESEPIRFWVV